MGQDGILPEIAELLAGAARIDRAEVTRDQRLRDDLGLDSLAMIDLVVAAEDRFGMRVPDEEVDRLRTVGDLVDYIRAASPGA